MKEVALTNGASEPNLDEIEVEYQHVLTLRCAASLQFPPLTIMVTSLIILHVISVSGLTEQTKMADYQSASVTCVVESHFTL